LVIEIRRLLKDLLFLHFALGFFENRNGPRLGHRLQDFMVPFFPLIQNRAGFTSAINLGYTYDYIDGEESSFAYDALRYNFNIEGSAIIEGSAVENSFDPTLQQNDADKFNSESSIRQSTWLNPLFAHSFGQSSSHKSHINLEKKNTWYNNRYRDWHDRSRHSEGNKHHKHGTGMHQNKLTSAAVQQIVLPEQGMYIIV